MVLLLQVRVMIRPACADLEQAFRLAKLAVSKP